MLAWFRSQGPGHLTRMNAVAAQLLRSAKRGEGLKWKLNKTKEEYMDDQMIFERAMRRVQDQAHRERQAA